jgi:hypothetical protein
MTKTADGFALGFGSYFWGGAIYNPMVGCDYRFSVQGRVIQRVGDVSGIGYGVAVRGRWTGSEIVSGPAIQYDPGADGFRVTEYPDVSGGRILPAPTDQGWHRVEVTVVGHHYEHAVDGKVVASGDTGVACGGSPVLRVWGAQVEFRDLQITPAVNWVSLGDSYSAGVGLGAVVPPCDRDDRAYASLAASRLGGQGRVVVRSFQNVACSGATTSEYWTSHRQVQGDVITPNTTLVSLTFGGNDISFKDKVIDCLIPPCGADLWSLSPSRAGAGDGLTWSDVRENLLAIYIDIRNRMDPNGHLYVLSYPMPFALAADNCYFVFDLAEQLAANALVTKLDDTIAAAVEEANAQRRNVHFVDWRTGPRVASTYEIPAGYPGAGQRFDVYVPPDGLCNAPKNPSLLNGFEPTLRIEPDGIFVSADNSLHPSLVGYNLAASLLSTHIAAALSP